MKSNIEELNEIITAHTYGSWKAQKTWKTPIFVADAERVYFYDHTGKRYLDFSSQLMCSNLGHKNKALIEAITRQAEKLPYVAPGLVCEIKATATKALLEIMPEGLNVFFYSTSGTEANEAAIKIVRAYFASTSKYKVIARYHSYHGSTAASIALTGDIRRWYAEPLGKLPGVIFAPDPYCYRCPFKLEYPECKIMCAEYVDYMIKNEETCCHHLEPVVGTNGIIVPPKEYMPRLRQIADENGVIFIVDEVMSGWFRTGKWFAINHWNVVPDILTTAKGSTGAYVPLGITATKREIREHFEERYFPHGHTYAAHPMTLAPVMAAVEEYKKLDQSGHMSRVSQYLAKRLEELKSNHKCVGDVRGLGHFWAVEIVKNRETKEPFNTRADKAALKPLMTDRVSAEAQKKGVYITGWVSHLIIAPPLIITEEQIDEGVNVLDEALKIADQEAT